MQFSNKLYDILKWICLVALPALGAFLGILLPTLGVDADICSKVIICVNALAAFIGTLIGISSASYKNND